MAKTWEPSSPGGKLGTGVRWTQIGPTGGGKRMSTWSMACGKGDGEQVATSGGKKGLSGIYKERGAIGVRPSL